ncbi:MAG: YfcE family phosphodiesterase [Mycoplasmatota bacterium]
MILFVSDIHGLSDNVKKIISYFEKAEKIIILGDTFYNNYNLDTSYIKDVIKKYKSKTIIIRGNCDLDSDYSFVNNEIFDIYKFKLGNKNIVCTHGHLYNHKNYKEIDSVLIYGHLHNSFIVDEGCIYINTGSLSFPRNNSKASFLVYDEKFILYDVDFNIIDEVKI